MSSEFAPLTLPVDVGPYPLLGFSCPESHIVALLGPAIRDSEPADDEPGPTRYWAARCRCGLRLYLSFGLLHNQLTLHASSPDAAHVLHHFPAPRGADVWIDDSIRNTGRCRVMRTDDHGSKYCVAEECTREHAHCLVQDFEARGHKQTYWVECPD